MGYSTTDALARIRRAVRISTTDVTYTTAVILDMLDAVIHVECVPAIKNLNSDYWLTYEDIAITANRSRYPIPTRALLNQFHSVEYLNTNKTTKEVLKWRHIQDMGMGSVGEPGYHYILDDTLLIYPVPSSAVGYLRIYYHYLPSNLVATSECMLITGGTGTGILTGVAPASWTTSLKYDIVAGESPYALINSNLTASAVTVGVSVTFPLANIDSTRLGSGTYYVTKTRETCFPMIPSSCHNLACDMVVAKIREEIGDEGFTQKFQLTQKQLMDLINALVPRKDTETKPIINRRSLYNFFG